MYNFKSEKLVLIVIILLAMRITADGKKIGSITGEYFKTPILRVDDNQFYIVDQELKIGCIFNRKSFKKVGVFGGPGQGPGEFSGISSFMVDDRYIYITNFPKLSIFSKQGQLIKEIKLTSFVSALKPIGDNFIGSWYPGRTKHKDLVQIQFSLYDSNLKKKKNLLNTKIEKYADFKEGKKIIYWIRDCAEAFVYKDRIYIGTTGEGFYFSVFDEYGSKLYDIRKDMKKKYIPEKSKQKTLNAMRHVWGEARWSQVKIIIRDYYPAYMAFFVSDDKIYVFGFPLPNYEINILDLRGNLLKIQIISPYELLKVSSRYDCMYNGKLYYLIDKQEYIDIHETDIWNSRSWVNSEMFLQAAGKFYSKFRKLIKRIFFIFNLF